MKLHQLLPPNRIRLGITAKTREDVIEQLIALLDDDGVLADSALVREKVLHREHQVGTGIGYGVAIPHTEPGSFPDPLAVMGRLTEPVDFLAPDKKPARLVFLLLTPEKTPALHVRLLARICRLLRSAKLREKLLNAADSEHASNLIAAAEADFPELNQ